MFTSSLFMGIPLGSWKHVTLLAILKSVAVQVMTVILPSADMLHVLPPELRFKIYSYVFSTEDEGVIVLRVMRKGDWVSDLGLAPYPILLQDPRYNRYRGRPKNRGIWTDPIEEAFHKGGTKL